VQQHKQRRIVGLNWSVNGSLSTTVTGGQVPNSNIQIVHADSLQYLRTLPDNCFDSIVTDPPYGLKFMAKKWDYDVPSVALWAECLRVLKPGGYLLAFAGTRTQHRMAVRIEDAGFFIGDMIAWVYGSGFPKSVNVGKELEQYLGYGTGLKPAMEPITVAMKPREGTIIANLLAHGVGAYNIDGCRIPFMSDDDKDAAKPGGKTTAASGNLAGKAQGGAERSEFEAVQGAGRWPANLIHDGSDEVLAAFPNTASGKGNTKKSSASDTNGNQGAAYGGESRPAGTEMISYGDKGSAARFFYCAKASPSDRNEGCEGLPAVSAGEMTGGRKEGSAGLNNPRAGAGRTGGGKNFWPTVKPTALMRYLVKLVTPEGGKVLDPFCGSGSTGKAAALEGYDAVLIDLDADAIMLTEARVSHAAGRRVTRLPLCPPDWDEDLDGPWQPPAERCPYCDGTGDVHRADGEWLGVCTCGKPADWDDDLDGEWSPDDSL
jgi:16S rRNA G966 N2-methylase RsmD